MYVYLDWLNMATLYKSFIIPVTIVWLICDSLALKPVTVNGLLTYGRDELLLHRSSPPCYIKPAVAIPPELRPRKRGRRGGVRSRLRRRPFRPPLPSIILSNVRSLRNKMDLLHARCRMERAFRDICIIALTETWLDDSVSDDEVSLDNFTIIRSDRTRNSGKTRGGGLCLYINDRWCSNIKTHRRVCSPDLEMLTVSLRPYYLPREFPTVVVSCVYIEPSANGNIAAELVAEDANAMAAKYPGSPVLILGDFNTCRLDSVLPTFQQYVDTPTRGNNILDLCYGNNSEAFRTNSYPPLGLADHNVICLLPLYKQVLKRLHPQSYSAPQWSEDSTAQLQGSLACTDWTIFDGDLNSKVTAISDYINFCIHTTIPVKAIKKIPQLKTLDYL